MDSDLWAARLSISSRRYQSRSDLFFRGSGHEEVDGQEDFAAEFLCPFCAEDYDVVGLCCHIDGEHPVQAKNGVCPICAKKVGMDIVGHVTMQHGSFLKVQRKRRFRKGGSNSTFSLLSRELREGSLQPLLGGSSSDVSSNTEPDPLLSSFMYSAPADKSGSAQFHSSVEASSVKENTKEDLLERYNTRQLPLSDKDQEKKIRKCEFVQGLLLSTIIDDN